GTTRISWTARDNFGNSITAFQDVIVRDTEGPIFPTLNSIVQDQDAGVCQAVVTVPNPVVTDLCGEVATGFKITRSDGKTSLTAPFPVGKTTITWIATDKSGNESQATQDVIVKDTEGPIFEPLNPIVVDQDAGVCQAVVSVPNPVVTDLCGEVATGFKITRSDGETSLTAPFPVGKTTITWIATDKSGNESQATQDVIVIDIEKPSVIGLPSNIVVNNDKGVCGALVSWTAPTSSDNCSGSTILQTAGPASGSVFPVGETTVTYTATDASGNTYSASFTVSVNDTEDPVIEGMPANISVSSDADKCGAIVTWTAPTAKDNCEVKTFTTSHAPGSLFPVGTTTVTYTAEDIHGNVQTASFDVTVTNNAPSNLVITAPIIPQAIGTAVNVSATFVDENIKSAKWTAFDGNIVTQTATISATGTSTAYTFTSLPAGVYTIILEVEDHCGLKASQQFEFVTVYDPNGGFVTGGGWIYSKPGDLRTKPEAEGRANFGFVAKYKTGKNLVDQVEGNTNFQFKEGDFHFKSTSHQNMSLVISGAKATYRGEGTVNGLGSHKFMVTVIDGDLRGELDKFRIRVWANNSSSDVIYDNEYSLAENAEATTLLGGGSIVIHKPVTKGNKRVSTEMIEVPWNTPIETVKKEVEKMSLTWFEAKKLPMTIQSDSYNPLVPGIYELKADLVENEFYSLDEPISILVMVQNKPMPLDITIDNNKLAKGMKAGEVIGIMRTLDPVDNIHTYTLGENPDVELDGDKLVWKGSTIPARLDLTVFSSDRAGQTISREITLRREMKPGEFFVYPNPATEETNVMVEMDQSSTVAIRIFDAVGRLVMENQAVREGSFTQKIDLQGLAAGMYTIQVEAGNMVMTKRLIKK
ncbi:HYR domain-containing protein, partial [Algoriphagus boseongensis]|uniref:HYR domain-containing protein n=1 Tax=Algoriphagus boseongensis TaxID=1442587 RepID=UPI001414FC6A